MTPPGAPLSEQDLDAAIRTAAPGSHNKPVRLGEPQTDDLRVADAWLSEQFPGWRIPAPPSGSHNELPGPHASMVADAISVSNPSLTSVDPAILPEAKSDFASSKIAGPSPSLLLRTKSIDHKNECASCGKRTCYPSPGPSSSNSFDSSSWNNISALQHSNSLGSSSISSADGGLASSEETGSYIYPFSQNKSLLSVGLGLPSGTELNVGERGKFASDEMKGLTSEPLIAVESYYRSLKGEAIRAPPWLSLRLVSGP